MKIEKGCVVQFTLKHNWYGSLGIIEDVKQVGDDIRYMVQVPIPMRGKAFIYVMESEKAIELIGKSKIDL